MASAAPGRCAPVCVQRVAPRRSQHDHCRLAVLNQPVLAFCSLHSRLLKLGCAFLALLLPSPKRGPGGLPPACQRMPPRIGTRSPRGFRFALSLAAGCWEALIRGHACLEAVCEYPSWNGLTNTQPRDLSSLGGEGLAAEGVCACSPTAGAAASRRELRKSRLCHLNGMSEPVSLKPIRE